MLREHYPAAWPNMPDVVSRAGAWSGTAIVVRGDEVVDEWSLGVLDRPGSGGCSPAMRVQACSISKLVLSVAVLALVERQELNLKSPITTWLTAAPDQWSTVTLHQLLSHTSGLGHWGDVPGLPSLLVAPPPRDDLIALVVRAPSVSAPGTAWRYSGPGFLVAALVVEAATGRAYSEVVSELVLAPAGLVHTTSGVDPALRPEMATGHHDGVPLPLHPNFVDIPGSGDL